MGPVVQRDDVLLRPGVRLHQPLRQPLLQLLPERPDRDPRLRLLHPGDGLLGQAAHPLLLPGLLLPAALSRLLTLSWIDSCSRYCPAWLALLAACCRVPPTPRSRV